MSLVWINCFRRLKLEAQDAAKEEREKTIRERKELKLNRKEKLPVKSPNRKVSFNSIIRVKVFTLDSICFLSEQIFLPFVWKIEDNKMSFWDFLTFISAIKNQLYSSDTCLKLTYSLFSLTLKCYCIFTSTLIIYFEVQLIAFSFIAIFVTYIKA